jgi:hypothetical protein
MSATQLRGAQVLDGSIQRLDLDTSTVGKAVIAKAIQGTGIAITSTGGDAGTGDVTINVGTVPVANGGTGATTAATARANLLAVGGGANGSTAQQSLSGADAYLAGSAVVIPAGGWQAGTTYKCFFDVTKSALGVAAWAVSIRMGTAGSTSDPIILTITSPYAQTAVADTGHFEVWVNFRTVGSGTSATIVVDLRFMHNLTTTGLSVGGQFILGSGTLSAGFNSTTPTTIGVSFNGGSGFSGTVQVVQAELYL